MLVLTPPSPTEWLSHEEATSPAALEGRRNSPKLKLGREADAWFSLLFFPDSFQAILVPSSWKLPLSRCMPSGNHLWPHISYSAPSSTTILYGQPIQELRCQVFFVVNWNILDRWHCVSLKGTTCWFNTFIYCNMIIIVALTNTSLTSHNYHFVCECVVRIIKI